MRMIFFSSTFIIRMLLEMYNAIEEDRLAELCRSCDRLAADELYRRYAPRLLTLCGRYTSVAADASDLMHDAMIRALEKISSYKYCGKGSLYAWISRIAINMALGGIRKQKWRPVPLDEATMEDVTQETMDDARKVPPEKLLEMVAALPQVRRLVFNLFCIDGISHREIGKMLGIGEKSSASQLARARKQLRGEIKQYMNENG